MDRHKIENCGEGPVGDLDQKIKSLVLSNSHTESIVSELPADLGEHVSTINQELLPVNWPRHVKYLVDYEYHSSIPSFISDLVQGRRQRREKRFVNNKTKEEVEVEAEPRSELELEYDDIPIGHAIPGVLRTLQEPPFEIRLIESPSNHPVLGSYGLFATQTLRPGLHLLDYISLVVPDEHADPDSDHTLYLCNDLNLDASIHGNHGRFVNDFRGIRSQEQGPNVAWDLYRDEITGQVRMGCKVLKRIKPGEEILCNYGKDYWKSRGVKVEGNDWEDGWDTDIEDKSDTDAEDESDIKKQKK
ncbi:hypothetical protein BGZ46_010072 [Entomortierella lignicola]|nr:hypothetical protein BGZ46_010072 [Entomortierella lignicola]